MADINPYLHKRESVGATLIDLDKAFDTVWLDGLIYKLIKKKFPEHLLRLINNMLRGKKFYSTFNGQKSNIYTIQEGLQQGTVNSPLLFSIFTADILDSFELNTGNGTHSIAYADDLIIYVAGAHGDAIKEKLEPLVNKVVKYYEAWNLKANPAKCESILFRNPTRYLAMSKRKGFNSFVINTIKPGTRLQTQIPTKSSVKYLIYTIDHLCRGTEHVDIQLANARKAFQALIRLFNSRLLSNKSKIICYQIFTRSILTYAAPIWWNLGAAHMEKLRSFERSCLRTALKKHRTAETAYRQYTSNKLIYNIANISRIDCFILKLTRDYMAKLRDIDNPTIKQLSIANSKDCIEYSTRGYVRPQDFIHHDRLGIIQDEYNTPILYHWSRNKANKRLPPNVNAITNSRQKYSTILPDRDINDANRLSTNYWWLDDTATHIQNLRKRLKEVQRAKKNKQAPPA